MAHIKVVFSPPDSDISDVLIALLSDIGYSGFEEVENNLFAYIGQSDFNDKELQEKIAALRVPYTTEQVAAQNWNALWESNFQPVIVADFCTIRADFHKIEPDTRYDIIITPKMSFGTGHHATTQLMLLQMRDIRFQDKTVLDFGTGTGILAIMAALLGAKEVQAIDNDEWSVENAAENITRNNCSNIRIQKSSLMPEGEKFDIILANINRHILLEYMPMLYDKIRDAGQLLMSGLLIADLDIITEAATAQNFELERFTQKDTWISLLFKK